MCSRGWWVQLHWTVGRAGLAMSYLDTCLYPPDSPWRDFDPAAVGMFFVFCSSSVSNYQFLKSSFIQLFPPSDPGRSRPDLSIRPGRSCADELRVWCGTSVRSDKMVNLHVCARCQDSRWELTLAWGESVACLGWREDSRVCCGGWDRGGDPLRRAAKRLWRNIRGPGRGGMIYVLQEKIKK